MYHSNAINKQARSLGKDLSKNAIEKPAQMCIDEKKNYREVRYSYRSDLDHPD